MTIFDNDFDSKPADDMPAESIDEPVEPNEGGKLPGSVEQRFPSQKKGRKDKKPADEPWPAPVKDFRPRRDR